VSQQKYRQNNKTFLEKKKDTVIFSTLTL